MEELKLSGEFPAAAVAFESFTGLDKGISDASSAFPEIQSKQNFHHNVCVKKAKNEK